MVDTPIFSSMSTPYPSRTQMRQDELLIQIYLTFLLHTERKQLGSPVGRIKVESFC